MINCGGLADITQCFTLNSLTKVYIIDSHRPLNLENMHVTNTQVCVFDDQDETEKINKVMEAFDAVMVNICQRVIFKILSSHFFHTQSMMN
jgi:hypothetical protein